MTPDCPWASVYPERCREWVWVRQWLWLGNDTYGRTPPIHEQCKRKPGASGYCWQHQKREGAKA